MPQSEIKPLPCPYPGCGKVPTSLFTITSEWVACACGAQGPTCETQEEAIAAWNRVSAAVRKEPTP